ncbi:hypothetical protein B0H19DRAFT_1250739 [Mycena capillaripes]|nr:hypothetical protein B0H19DRAFT_1250739 [Mycena capillaripes]
MSSALPSDIVDQLLAASPNFDALTASIGVSKAWREAHEAHPTSIALAVARNMVGEALPQAVRFLRYPYPKKDDNEWPRDVDDEDDEDDSEEDSEDEERDGARGKRKRQTTIKLPRRSLSESAQIGELTPEERRKLQENAAIVAQLEALFSSRHKNRRYKTSQLTPLESSRFTRAMYRIMLYCELFYYPLMIDDTDAYEKDDPEIVKIYRDRSAMLNEYPTPELLEIRTVVAFLHDLIWDVEEAEGYKEPEHLLDICLSTGPAVILQAYLAKTINIFDEVLLPEVLLCGSADNVFWSGFVTTPLETVLKERQEVSPRTEWNAILDKICKQCLAQSKRVVVEAPAPRLTRSAAAAAAAADGVHPVPTVRVGPPRCSQCNGVGIKLWSENSEPLISSPYSFPDSAANWDTLDMAYFCAQFKGNLSKNEHEMEVLQAVFLSRTDRSKCVVEEIHDVKTPAFAAWAEEGDLCSACLDKLVSAHLHLWLLKRKVKEGWKPTPDCWYGYDCNTQVHNRAHAREKNIHDLLYNAALSPSLDGDHGNYDEYVSTTMLLFVFTLLLAPLLGHALPAPDFEATILAASDFLEFESFQSVSVAGVAGDVTTYDLIHFSESFHDAGTATLIEGPSGYTLTFLNPGVKFGTTTQGIMDECQFLGTTAASCVDLVNPGNQLFTSVEALVPTWTVTATGDRPTSSSQAPSRPVSSGPGAGSGTPTSTSGTGGSPPPVQSHNAGDERYKSEIGAVIIGVIGYLWVAI